MNWALKDRRNAGRAEVNRLGGRDGKVVEWLLERYWSQGAMGWWSIQL